MTCLSAYHMIENGADHIKGRAVGRRRTDFFNIFLSIEIGNQFFWRKQPLLLIIEGLAFFIPEQPRTHFDNLAAQ